LTVNLTAIVITDEKLAGEPELGRTPQAEVFPGGHGGFMTHPAEFARSLEELL